MEIMSSITNTAGPANNTGAETASPQEALDAERVHEVVPEFSEFTNFDGLMERLPWRGERCLREDVRRGRFPSIKLPGSRGYIFHWPSVRAALLRLQRGAE